MAPHRLRAPLASSPAHPRQAATSTEGCRGPSLEDMMPRHLGVGRRGAAGTGDLRTGRAGHLLECQLATRDAARWHPGTPPPRDSTRAVGRPERRRLGRRAHDPTSPQRPAAWCHPRHSRTRHRPPAAPSGVGRRQGPGACGTWGPLFDRPAVLSRLAVSDKACAHDGATDGDDGVPVGLCRLGIPSPPSAQRPCSDVS
jgi:hypothetical protein